MSECTEILQQIIFLIDELKHQPEASFVPLNLKHFKFNLTLKGKIICQSIGNMPINKHSKWRKNVPFFTKESLVDHVLSAKLCTDANWVQSRENQKQIMTPAKTIHYSFWLFRQLLFHYVRLMAKRVPLMRLFFSAALQWENSVSG